MTCTQMLERLIEAEPAALAGRGNSDVASHVRECARCRAVASQLLADTRMLALAVDRGAVVRRIRPIMIAPALAGAAALAFAMLPDQPSSPTTLGRSRAPVVAVTPVVVAPAVVSPALPAVVWSRTLTTVASTPAPRPQVARAYPPATPLIANPMQVAPTEISYQQVAVTPPPGKRAAVMRTSDPAITVVWVY
ncbi:MAG: hypothetical protein WD825_13640 [Gemmatimonadaceae bacterium]